jgi:hypothetical protein
LQKWAQSLLLAAAVVGFDRTNQPPIVVAARTLRTWRRDTGWASFLTRSSNLWSSIG